MQCKMRYVVNGGVVEGKQKRQRVVGFVGVGRRIGQAGCRALDAEGAAGADPGKLD